MFGFFLIMKAELVRSWIVMRRYWFRTLTSMVIGYGMLMVLILGFMTAGPSAVESLNGKFGDPVAATNFVLGFIIGLFAFSVVGMFTQGLQGMATTGVLEQLCMSPHGLITNFLARTTVGAVSTIISSSVMVWMVSYTVQRASDHSGQVLYWDSVAVPVILALTFINLLGFGFMVGGLVLIFKQIGQVAILIRMGLFALAIFAREELLQQGIVISAIMHALPITDASICLKYVLIKGQGVTEGGFSSVFTHPSFFFLLVSCFVWTALGMACFKTMENVSRAKGTLGAY